MTFYEVDMKIYQPEEVKYSPKPTAEVNIISEVDKSHVNRCKKSSIVLLNDSKPVNNIIFLHFCTVALSVVWRV